MLIYQVMKEGLQEALLYIDAVFLQAGLQSLLKQMYSIEHTTDTRNGYLPVPISLVQKLTFPLVENLRTEASRLMDQQHLFEQCGPAEISSLIRYNIKLSRTSWNLDRLSQETGLN